MGAPFQGNFHAGRIMVMVEQRDLFPNERYRGFIEPAVQGHGAVFGNTSSGAFAEVIFEVFGSGADTLHVIGIAFERGLCGRAMGPFMVDISQPAIEGFIELIQAVALKAGQKLGLDSLEDPFHLAPPFGLVGLGVNQSDAKGGGDFPKESGSEGGAVVDIEFSREPSFEQGTTQGGKKRRQAFAEIELGMRNQAAHVIYEGKQIGFAFFIAHADHRSVHGIRLPIIPHTE